MKNIAKHILAEKENVEKTLFHIKAAKIKGNKTALEIAGLAVFVHNFYNGIENILKQILKSKDVILGNSESWHKELLESSFSKGVISRELADRLYKYLAFRHFFIHSYGFKLDDARLLQLANDIPQVWSDFLSSIETYL
jgi:hypothetical protein